MTLKLIVTRHAKSSWDNLSLDDFDRPLNERGQKSADAIGNWLAENQYAPSAVLHSSAARTTETWERISKPLPEPEKAMGLDSLYLASSDRILTVLGTQSAHTVLLLGHNPGIGDFAHRVLASAPDHARFRDYPTAATLVCTFEAHNWKDVRWGTGHPVAFVVPKDLIGS